MKRYFIAFTLAFFLITFGIFLTAIEISNFKIIDELTNTSLEVKTSTYDLNLTKDTTRILISPYKKPVINYTNDIEQGKIKIVINYFNELVKVKKLTTTNDDNEIIYILADNKNNLSAGQKIVKMTIDGLKDKQIYNYKKGLLPNVQVFINENDKDIVKVGN